MKGVILEGEEIEGGHLWKVRRLRGVIFRQVRRLRGVILEGEEIVGVHFCKVRRLRGVILGR